jgi:hypothetical protein
MPRPTPASSRTARSAPDDTGGTLRFSTVNLALLAAGLVAIAGGFVLLGSGSIVAAPLLLVLGFVVLVPLGIIL